MIYTKCVYDKKVPDDGKWILVMRKWPRGIAKSKIDEWYKELGPSVELLSDWKKKKIDWAKYEKNYLEEIRKQKELIETLAEKEIEGDITLVCTEKDDKCCHRRILASTLIKQEIDILERFVEANPINAIASFSWDWFLLMRGEYKRVIQSCDRAIEFGKSSARIWAYRGMAYFYNSEYEIAKKDFSQAQKLGSKEQDTQLENFSNGMYFWASGMDKYINRNQAEAAQVEFHLGSKLFGQIEWCTRLGNLLEFFGAHIKIDSKFEKLIYPRSIRCLRSEAERIFNEMESLFDKFDITIKNREEQSLGIFIAKKNVLCLLVSILHEKGIDEKLLDQTRKIYECFPFSDLLTRFDEVSVLLHRLAKYKTFEKMEQHEAEILKLAPSLSLADGASTKEGMVIETSMVARTSGEILALLKEYIADSRGGREERRKFEREGLKIAKNIETRLKEKKRLEKEIRPEEKATLELRIIEGKLRVRVDDKQEKELELNSQQLNLLREIVRKKRIHWIEGLLIFPNWIKEKETPPNKKFTLAINRLNDEFEKKTGVRIAGAESKGRKSKGYSILKPNIEIIARDIEEAKKLYDEAEKAKKQKKFPVALRKIEEAILKDATIEMYSLLIETYCYSNEKNSKELLQKAEMAFETKIVILEDVLVYIEENLKSHPHVGIWGREEIYDYRAQIGIKLEKLRTQGERAKKLLDNIRHDLSKEENFWLQIANKIERFRKGKFELDQEGNEIFKSLLLDLEPTFMKVAQRVSILPWIEEDEKSLVDTAKRTFFYFLQSKANHQDSIIAMRGIEFSLIEPSLINFLVSKIRDEFGRDEVSKRISPNIDMETAERLKTKKELSQKMREIEEMQDKFLQEDDNAQN